MMTHIDSTFPSVCRSEEGKKELADWGMKFDKGLLKVKGRRYQPEKIKNARVEVSSRGWLLWSTPH